MASLRESLEAAFEAQKGEENEQELAQDEAQVLEEAPEAPARNERGQFAAKQAPDQAEQPEQPENPQPAEAAPEKVEHPKSWRKEFWEEFGKLPTNVAKYIHEREDDFHRGIQGYKERALHADDWDRAIAPFVENFRVAGKSPTQAVHDILLTENLLRHGTMQQKVAVLQDLIQAYGIDVNTPYQPPQAPQFDPQPIAQMVRQQVQQSTMENQAVSALQQFMANPPEHFEAVKDVMVQLLQSNMAASYQEAYDKAIRLQPDVWAQVSAKQAQDAEAAKREEAAKAAKAAKAKAISVKGASTGKQPDGGGQTDRRSAIAAALRQANETF